MSSCHPSAVGKGKKKREISLTFVCKNLEKGFLPSNVASKSNSGGFLFRGGGTEPPDGTGL